MTEQELRRSFALNAARWCGVKEGSAEHKQILDIYNRIRPLPRGYAVKQTDPWCAAFVSAVVWDSGFEGIMPMECSCPILVELAKKMGIWVELDSYEPQVGDWVLYNWQASGQGDDTGSPDHVGIVVHVQNGSCQVVEGNYDNSVKLRTVTRDQQFIRGFICPDYKSMETEYPQGKRYKTVEEAPEYSRQTLQKLTADGSLLGIREGDLGLTEEMIRILVILDRRGNL